MSNDQTFTTEQAAAANTSLRMALGLPPEQFGVAQFVGMISDEIEQLRKAGHSDDDIAAIVQESTGSPLTGPEIAQHYAPPEERGRSGNSYEHQPAGATSGELRGNPCSDDSNQASSR